MTPPKRSDFGPALTGLIVGGCLVYVIVFGIVQLTNMKFAGHSAPAGQSTEKAH